jgi:hypothetical protein
VNHKARLGEAANDEIPAGVSAARELVCRGSVSKHFS